MTSENPHDVIYEFYKCSSPGWEIKTTSIAFILFVLEKRVCEICKTYESGFPEQYDNLSMTEKLDVLLGTPCGAEYSVVP